MVVVIRGPKDTTDQVIKKFQKKVLSEGILLDLKKHDFYQKPAEIRKQLKIALKRKGRKGGF